MTEPVSIGAADVIAFHSQAQIVRETVEEIRCQFPRWKVWCTSTGTWNAYRADEEPYFGPCDVGGRAFMVSAYTSAQLIEMLHDQVRIDLSAQFPRWQLRRTSAGWAAFTWQREEATYRMLAKLVQRPTISGLRDALWAQSNDR
jgi:hypothetical protein